MQAYEPIADWRELAPRLDEAVAQLNEADRVAVLLRFFQNRRLREVGEALGMSEDTAQKRVARAIEKLRLILQRKGVVVPAALIGGLLATHAAQIAPSWLGPTVVRAAMGKTAPPTSVYALLQDALHRSLWPKIAAGSAVSLVIAVALVLGLRASPQSQTASRAPSPQARSAPVAIEPPPTPPMQAMTTAQAQVATAPPEPPQQSPRPARPAPARVSQKYAVGPVSPANPTNVPGSDPSRTFRPAEVATSTDPSDAASDQSALLSLDAPEPGVGVFLRGEKRAVNRAATNSVNQSGELGITQIGRSVNTVRTPRRR